MGKKEDWEEIFIADCELSLQVLQEEKAVLEKRCANYEMQISKMEKGICDVCKEIEKDRKLADLEKENAELKVENEANENGAKKYAEFYFETNDQLTKAKEIIKNLLCVVRNHLRIADINFNALINEADKFMQEN